MAKEAYLPPSGGAVVVRILCIYLLSLFIALLVVIPGVPAEAGRSEAGHRLNGHLVQQVQRVPCLLLAGSSRNCVKLCSSDRYVSLEG